MQATIDRSEPVTAMAATQTMADTVKVFTKASDFAAIEADWRALEALVPDASYFTSFDWCECWWNWFGQDSGREFAVLAVYAGDAIQALLPLTVARSMVFSSARLMGDDTGQYADCLVRPERRGDPALARAVASGLKRLGLDRITLTNCRDDSAVAELVGSWRGGRAGSRKTWIRAAEYSNVEIRPADFDGLKVYRSSRSSSLRKGLRRRRRKLAELGDVQYKRITEPGAFAGLAQHIVRLKLEWLDDNGLHGRYLARPGLVGWMAEVMARAAASGHLHMSVMTVDGRACAAQLAFQSRVKVTGYFSAFDIALSRNAVGKLHLEDLIVDIFEHDQVLDLMPPADSYKREWGVEVMKVAAYTVPLTPWGAFVSRFYSVKTRALAKSAYLRLPQGLRAGVAAGILDFLRRIKRTLAGSAPTASPSNLKRTEG
ncbi:hypothetical protein MNBD_ALPHA09-1883 [hydrothermal vent metagenome]|uniref:BioF2-like acetyltransferase domain-containing protein n=1 Tax=hydrothermal vent metagenome TaxID=652676 RepID=A0A3B0TH51_9ZZZZ